MTEAARILSNRNEPYADRRQFPRLTTETSADIVDSVDQTLQRPTTARVLNISRSGVALTTTHDLRIGATVSLVLYYEGYDSVCLGELMWKKGQAGSWTYGVLVKRWAFLDPVLESRLTALERKVQNDGLQAA